MDISQESEDLLPDPSWDLDQLAAYTRDRFTIADLWGRKSAVQIWRAGKAVLIVQERLKQERKWTAWAQEHDLPLTSVYEAIKIAEKFDSEADITGFTVIEAKMIAGTFKPKVRPKRESKGGAAKTKSGVTNVEPRDETPLGGTKDTGTSTGGLEAPKDESGPQGGKTPAPSDWIERLRRELLEEVASIDHTILVVQEWANRLDHPISAALVRALIEAELIIVMMDGDQEVVRVDDHDLIVALAAADCLDPVFARLGVTHEIASRHLLAMLREGRGGDAEPPAGT
jgi:hypothetical protein